MYRIAPEQAAALRRDLERHTNVSYTGKHVLSTLKADLTAADAAAACAVEQLCACGIGFPVRR